MENTPKIWVYTGKFSLTEADALVMTLDPNRMLFGNIDREIRKSSKRGNVYFIQLPRDRIENLGTFVSYGNYQTDVRISEDNILKCDCRNCNNFKSCLMTKRGGLHCAAEIGKYNCSTANHPCLCDKCQVHRDNHLNSEYYCTRGSTRENRGKKVSDIIFVSDFYYSPLREIVVAALERADLEGYKVVAMPALRMQTMWKDVEKNDEAKAQEMAAGLAEFIEKHPNSRIETIKFIIDNNPLMYRTLIIEIEKYKTLKKKLGNKRRGIFGL